MSNALPVCNFVYLIDGSMYGCKNEAIWLDTRMVNYNLSGGGFGRVYFRWCGYHKPRDDGGYQGEITAGVFPIVITELPEDE